MSWLVRCWEEPREGEAARHEEPVLRCSMRDLKTGEERFFTDPREIGELMLRQTRALIQERTRAVDLDERRSG
jgi:hypothetical protein